MNIKMLKKTTLFMVLALHSPVVAHAIINPTILTVPVEYPTVLQKIPQSLQNICLYYCGQRIHRDEHKAHNKLFFSFLESRMVTHFYLLIIDSMPDLELITGNTVDYLKIDPAHRYKFYSLSLVAQESENSKKVEYVWAIIEITVPPSGQLPDNTLIMSYNPDLVDCLAGGNAIELPTIVLKKDIDTTHEAINQQSIEVALSALDFNAFHESTKKDIVYDPTTKTVRMITT
jgi:hypothetical protein